MEKSFLLVVTYNSAPFIEQCLRSVFAQDEKDFFVLVIDNHSSDESIEKIKEFKNSCPGLDSRNFKMIAMKRNIGFSRAVNYGVFQYLALSRKEKRDDFKHLVLINPDLCLEAGALSELTKTAAIAGEDCGASGGLIMDYDCDKVSHCGAKIKPNYITEHVKDECSMPSQGNDGVIASDYVTGALFACEIDLFVQLCGFDPGYRPAYFEELDFCLKLKKIGKRAYVNPKSRARHFECGSVKKFSPSFYYYYHKNRIRCAIIHESPKDLFMRFLAAEITWLRRQASKDQYGALCRAYLVNLFFIACTVSVKIKNYFLLKKIV